MKNQGHRQHFKFAYMHVVIYFRIVTCLSKEFQNIVYIIESFSNKAHLPYSQGRLSNSNQSAVLFLGAKCKLQLSSHSLLPHNAEWEGKRVCTHNAE